MSNIINEASIVESHSLITSALLFATFLQKINDDSLKYDG